ncbi:chromosome segregation protein SMC [Gordonibacter pamelaeae]|uniref:Chromosome partition protein Smc n=2 Tax=Gordonibacter pamelaeae TaxID=471189 RepID=A0A369LVM9_9ACTN|nr:chromosome segregation protein SMC [Gordonibacter pamelaeae]RDB63591.1 chromosome segregation protein SMC [Gordonibacter pamelaeae]
MYLKSLVLKGFKSFADRSALALEPGITAVVGPNGSGKSNISDAVLWVLGERNAKNLRGQAMEDVIFAGSSARKPVGIAEVDLVLDNSDGTLPVDFAEVAITRRMYRSGESEYLINGVVARRMDVLDILHDTGLGTGTHSIISQGSLDSILQSKPEDRRALIEEAAGVLKHKQRKAKSERKLEHMDQHLARVKDVAAEVERQLGPLERKAKRARAYQGLSAELSELTLALAVDDLRVLQRAWDEAVGRERALDEELAQKKAAIAEAEARVEELQERIRRESADAGELAKTHRRASSAVERFDGATLLLHEKRRAAQAREAELRVALEAGKARRAAAEAERAQAAAQVGEVRAERERADADVARLAEEHASLTERHRALDREAAALTEARRSAERAQEQARRELATTQESLASGLAHVKLIEGHGKELELQLERSQADAAALAEAAAAAGAALEALAEREAAARGAVSAAFTAREAARTALEEARDEASLLASEIKGLEEVERASAAAGPARAWLLDHADELSCALAPLSHVLRAEAGSEALVERLLGGDVAALLVDEAAGAAAVAAALASCDEQGEVVLVARADAAGPARAAGELPARAAAAAGLGRALVDGLSYPPEAARAVEALLGDVVVCDGLDAALAAHARDASGARFVTEDGCVVWPGGKVTLGAAAADDAEGVLARARRLDGLRARFAEAEASRDAAQQASAAAEEALRQAQGESLRLSQELAELRGKTDAARADARRAEEKLAAVRREFEDIERQRAEAERTVAEARPSVEALEQRLAGLARQLEEDTARLAEAQDAVVPLRKQAAQVRDALAEAKLKAATLAERETYTSRVADARAREIEQAAAADAEAREGLLRKVVAQRRIEPLLALMEELSDSARRRTRALEDAANAAQDAAGGMHQAANEARTAARAAHDAFDEANARMGQARVDKGRLEVQVEGAVNAIVHDCKVPLDHALALPELEDRGAVEDQAFKLRRRIANMGTINPDAADEYERLKERYDYLAAQLADLDGARRALGKIVRVIDARMKDDFVRTFDAVSKNFSEIFAVLFPGGSAELSLVDPDDLENTGVEVTAQPRGKRITKMMLMSGGEKSLTALALLFAVYRIRTTPFYILDEVEAALDDSNLRRLTSYLESLRDSTQLIMITHQRRTMEMADVLFGVSMQADGVTKVVSQKLEHALRHAE